MHESTTFFKASDGVELFVRTWRPEQNAPVQAVLQIHHGMAEHGARYARFAEAAVQEGFVVVAHDARAHGKTAERSTPPMPPGSADLGVMGTFRLVEDMKELIQASRAAYPGLPLMVLGHSLGSMVCQHATGSEGVLVDGLVLSGPPARMKGFEVAGLNAIITMLAGIQGVGAFSSIPDKLTFQKYQSKLLGRANIPNVTGFEWLSRDPVECKKYADDPHCGHLMSNGWFKALVPLVSALSTPVAVAPAKVPVLVIQGESDTCGINDFGTHSSTEIQALYRTSPRKLAPKVVMYGGARHELFNETNRDEVTHDTIDFFKTCIPGAKRSRL